MSPAGDSPVPMPVLLHPKRTAPMSSPNVSDPKGMCARTFMTNPHFNPCWPSISARLTCGANARPPTSNDLRDEPLSTDPQRIGERRHDVLPRHPDVFDTVPAPIS